jgi:SAM-dependent methyltransferase
MSNAVALEVTPCPVCASDDAAEIADAGAVKSEIEALWEFHARRLDPRTPVAQLTDRVAFSQRPPVRVVQCRDCGLVYRNPRERAFEVTDLYEDETPTAERLAMLFETQRTAYRGEARRLRRVLGRGGAGLEVGSYVGGFLAAARDEGLTFEGLDINETATAFARERGFRVTTGDLDSWAERRTFVAIAVWNCFDQLPDPRGAVRTARSLLQSGGLLAVRVPNGGFYAAVRRRMQGPLAPIATALLAYNNLLGFPYRHGFTVASLTRLLEANGFDVVYSYGDTLVPTADRWTRRWAAVEERLAKAMLHATARVAGANGAPWFELYAHARSDRGELISVPGRAGRARMRRRLGRRTGLPSGSAR